MVKVFTEDCIQYPLRRSQLVIRFGKLSGSSRFGLAASRGQLDDGPGEEWKRETGKVLEAGLSCYFIKERPQQGTFSIQKPLQSQAMYSLGPEYFQLMLGRVLVKPIAKGLIYVIKTEPFKSWDEPGTLVAASSSGPEDYFVDCSEFVEMVYGSDGEPLLNPDYIDPKNVTQVDLDEFLTKFYIGERQEPVGEMIVVEEEED